MLDALNKVAINNKKIELHSLRAGGAAEATSLGVSDRLFQNYGHWKSERVKNVYAHEKIPVRLQIPNKLGL